VIGAPVVWVREHDSNLLRGFVDDVDDEYVVVDKFVGVDANSVDGKCV
jgi:hypothetical protein